MMKAILYNWSLMRVLRLIVCILAVIQAYIQKDIMLGLLAGMLLIMAIANVGCCSSHGCAVNLKRNKSKGNIIYEEVDAKE